MRMGLNMPERMAAPPRRSTDIDVVDAPTGAPGTPSQALAGGGVDIAESAADVVQVEGAATSTASTASTAQAWLFCPDAEPREVALDEAPRLVAVDSNFVWVDLSGYAEDELHMVARLFDLDAHAMDRTAASWQRPQLHVFKKHFYVTATVARLDAAAYKVHASRLDLFVGANFLVSAHRPPVPFAGRILLRAQQSPELVHLDAAYMLYIVLDELLAHYESLNEQVQGAVEKVEERALTDTSDAFLSDLLRFKRYAFALGQLAEQHREVFSAFLRPDFGWVSGSEVEAYFRDLENRLAHLRDMLLVARDNVNGAFDIYVSHVSHRTNSVIKVLTMVSAVLFSMTVIIGLFSTSIQGLPIDRPAAYALMLALMLGVGGAILFVFHRNRWF